MRVLGRVRLSRLTEESTSAARQREIIEQWAKANDHEIVGWAEDVDVSGSVDPFDTPQLGGWLRRPDEWDILCAWKLDRVGRRAIPLNKLFGWTLENRKVLVCVSDNIDLSTWVGRLVANVIAGVAEGELEAIRERTYRPAESHQTALEAAVRAVDELSTLLGTITSTTMRERLTEQMRALDAEIGRLEQLPDRPAGWELKETGLTFNNVWGNSTLEEKRKLVIDKGITVRIIKDNDGIHFYVVTQKSPSSHKD